MVASTESWTATSVVTGTGFKMTVTAVYLCGCANAVYVAKQVVAIYDSESMSIERLTVFPVLALDLLARK